MPYEWSMFIRHKHMNGVHKALTFIVSYQKENEAYETGK
jgi:hypothetical protein